MQRRASRRPDRKAVKQVTSMSRRLSTFLLGVVFGVLVSLFMVITLTEAGISLAVLGNKVTPSYVKQTVYRKPDVRPILKKPIEPHRSTPSHQEKTVPKEVKKRAITTKYDFYEILKDEKEKSVTKTPPSLPPQPVALPVGYYLKVASLRSTKDAEALKARLVLDGYHAMLKHVNVNTVLWSRVMVGPYATIKEASAAQTALQSENLHAILLKSDQVS